MFAKLLPEEGFLRVDPGWKWMNLEVGNKVDGLSPFYVLPTCQVSEIMIRFVFYRKLN